MDKWMGNILNGGKLTPQESIPQIGAFVRKGIGIVDTRQLGLLDDLSPISTFPTHRWLDMDQATKIN